MQGKCVKVENFTASAHQQCSLICIIHCTVECFLQLLQILIVSLLFLHINIVGDVTCSDNSTRRLVTCICWFIVQFISLSHYTVPLMQRQHHNTRKNEN